MKIQVNKTTTEEVDITLPYFFKTSAHWVAILSEEEGIQITECMGYSLQLVDGVTLADRFINSKPEPISEQEFFAKYDEVNEINNNLINKYR